MNARVIVTAIVFLPLVALISSLIMAFLPILPGVTDVAAAYPIVLILSIILALPAAIGLSGLLMRSRFANRRSREEAPPALRYDEGRDERNASPAPGQKGGGAR
ncbi:MAG: hypothetical protein JJU21_05095 [Salinarimonas sp.]|nr:hypothetical protein [Salinarimonas sp.]